MQTECLDAIQAAGFTPLGWFVPTPEDNLPAAHPNRPTRTVVLIGNAGPEMWRRFAGERDPAQDLMDDWTRDRVDILASKLGARALYPFDPPYHPFQRWAQRAGNAFSSPLGLSIHPVYGLWHAYRAALLFDHALDLPTRASGKHPCNSCPTRPCLSACPVGAFTGSSYDVDACAQHVRSGQGAACYGGCLARHACPIGQDYAYGAAQARFHMTHFLKSRARHNMETKHDDISA